MGYYLLTASLVPILISLGGESLYWPIAVLASPLLISAAQDGVQIRFRRWGLILWGFAIVVISIAWLPRFAFLRSWPTYFSQVLLAALVIRAFRRKASGDREMAGLFAAYFVVRWQQALQLLHLPGSFLNYYLVIGGWRWSTLSMFITILGAMTVGLFYQRSGSRPAREVAHGRGTGGRPRRAAGSDFGRDACNSGLHPGSRISPFSQVGGDFFQILPVTSNSVLVALGDVSGKGVPAAMTVSQLVGILRFAAETSSSPKIILAALNRSLCGRGAGGFTTCLVLRADSDGTLTMANAGHWRPIITAKSLAWKTVSRSASNSARAVLKQRSRFRPGRI